MREAPTRRGALAPLALLALVLLLAQPAAAQEVRVVGARMDSASAVLRAVIAGGDYLRITRDTVLPASFHTTGDLLVVGAEVKLEGRVAGRAAVLNGALFLRPGSFVGGAVSAVGGEILSSAKSRHGPIYETPPGYTVRLSGTAPDYERVEVLPPPPPPRLTLGGFKGLGPPTYDRVNGLSLPAEASVRLSESPEGARLQAEAIFRGARRALDGALTLDAPAGPLGRATLRVERATLTPDAWAVGDFYNSVAVLLAGRDYRDYYASDRLVLRFSRGRAAPLVAGELALAPRLVLLAERDRSLRAHDVWSLARPDSGWRANPAIDEGLIASITAGARLAWRGTTSAAHADVEVEQGLGSAGDFAFTHARSEASVRVRAFGLQTMTIHVRAIAPLGGGAPRQRWEILGGAATIPTLDIGERRGDHLAFVRSTYTIPLPRLVLPYAGIPAVQLLHVAGSAWTSGEEQPAWTQNLGAGLAVRFLSARLYTDPARRPLRPVFVLALAAR